MISVAEALQRLFALVRPTGTETVQLADAHGRVLAQEFVTRWTEIHNPEIPAHIIKQYGLPGDSSIVVTSIMIDRNLDGFSKIMKLLRDNDVVPTNHDELVAAFGACYGKAEVYELEDIERVFGPIGEMPDLSQRNLT